MNTAETPADQSACSLILASASPRRRELIALLGLPFVVLPSRYEEPPASTTPVTLPDYVRQLAHNKAAEVAQRLIHEEGRKRIETEQRGQGEEEVPALNPLYPFPIQAHSSTIVLAADTLVAPDDADVGVPLGKPVDTDDALRMLRLLSGRVHRVYTAVSLIPLPTSPSIISTTIQSAGTPAIPRSAASPLPAEHEPPGDMLEAVFLRERSASVCTRVRFREMSEAMIAGYVATGEPMDKAGAYGAQGYAAPFIESFEGDFFNVVGLPLCTVRKLLEEMGVF